MSCPIQYGLRNDNEHALSGAQLGRMDFEEKSGEATGKTLLISEGLNWSEQVKLPRGEFHNGSKYRYHHGRFGSKQSREV
ncbi:unnamed protein product [marine sediment metagenome]|uniref:Uncharacterized protein n=1 Tax=marine sediment metagenome TaxID=412755 RepID=X1U0Q5_9ZZZZ